MGDSFIAELAGMETAMFFRRYDLQILQSKILWVAVYMMNVKSIWNRLSDRKLHDEAMEQFMSDLRIFGDLAIRKLLLMILEAPAAAIAHALPMRPALEVPPAKAASVFIPNFIAACSAGNAKILASYRAIGARGSRVILLVREVLAALLAFRLDLWLNLEKTRIAFCAMIAILAAKSGIVPRRDCGRAAFTFFHGPMLSK